MEKDEWKDVPGYEGTYEIHNSGVVMNSRLMRVRSRIGTLGYEVIALQKNGVKGMYYLHRLLALAFIPNPQGKPQVNHIDENRSNNDLSNLEWVTARENINHSLHKFKRGSASKNSKLKEDEVQEILTLIAEGEHTYKQIAAKFGVKDVTISAIKNGRSWAWLTGL